MIIDWSNFLTTNIPFYILQFFQKKENRTLNQRLEDFAVEQRCEKLIFIAENG